MLMAIEAYFKEEINKTPSRDPIIHYTIGQMGFALLPWDEVFNHLEVAVNQGHADSQNTFGMSLHLPVIPSKTNQSGVLALLTDDPAQAFLQFQAAANQGNPLAQNNLGMTSNRVD